MSEPVRHLPASATASTDGLEDLFVDVSEVQLHATASQLDATARSCTVKEASELLGVPTSTIYRRIKAGKYAITGNDETGAQIISVQLHATAPQSKPQLHAVETQLAASLTDNAAVAAMIEMSQKLEAANYRIGWLESQLLEREREVKLLTDSQHKPSHWAQFKKWFLG